MKKTITGLLTAFLLTLGSFALPTPPPPPAVEVVLTSWSGTRSHVETCASFADGCGSATSSSPNLLITSGTYAADQTGFVSKTQHIDGNPGPVYQIVDSYYGAWDNYSGLTESFSHEDHGVYTIWGDRSTHGLAVGEIMGEGRLVGAGEFADNPTVISTMIVEDHSTVSLKVTGLVSGLTYPVYVYEDLSCYAFAPPAYGQVVTYTGDAPEHVTIGGQYSPPEYATSGGVTSISGSQHTTFYVTGSGTVWLDVTPVGSASYSGATYFTYSVVADIGAGFVPSVPDPNAPEQ